MEPGPAPDVSAPFADAEGAVAAVEALVAAGIPREAVSVTLSATQEGRLLWRLVISIVLWSILGGAVGAGAGLALARAGIGPSGTTGTLVQAVSWLIIGHLLAGMWAGYVLLADRSHREMASDRESRATVTVRCRDRAESEAALRVLGER